MCVIPPCTGGRLSDRRCGPRRVGEVDERAVAHAEVQHVAEPDGDGGVLHVKNGVVRGRAEDLHARESRREVEGIAVIDAARGAERAAADAAVGVFARFAEGVYGQLADGIAGLRLALHDLHAEGEHVTAQKVGIAAVDAAEEGELADAQMVDARGQRAVKHHVDGGGRAAGDILQLAAMARSTASAAETSSRSFSGVAATEP